ncbi:hypothetical protein JQ631_08225 [Bradyrhizobium manausense]|uniref:hypothetical protein n=1 Tax=Bradyrhizobium manausense TaxID=989370 RepID=UPI001BA622DB|nr:hypothetical protein [Bradyrhizobium manausense]MBR0789052.1 hypothetical protein [Bradyrhizobium manausense]
MANTIATLVVEDRLKPRNALNAILNGMDAQGRNLRQSLQRLIFLRKSADARPGQRAPTSSSGVGFGGPS